MKERRIIFSAPMIRAILAGHKTQTRRTIAPQPTREFYCWPRPGVALFADGDAVDDYPDGCDEVVCPHGAAGDRLWVRETWGVGTRPCPQRGWVDGVEYRADGVGSLPGELPLREIPEQDLDGIKRGWRSPIFMPRWASRISLEITDARVQRLQALSESDALAEGVSRNDAAIVFQHGAAGSSDELSWTARGAYAVLWDAVNRRRALWASNPMVWALTFKLCEAP